MELMLVFLSISLLWQGSSSYHQDDADYDFNYPDVSEGLVLLHVIHRHGGRIRDENTYPRDPHLNETFYPYGYQQLTNNGRRKLYGVGKYLRTRYNNFLGDLYNVNEIEPFSTDTNRTKMSILLTLAGLYPPRGTSLDWDIGFNWQPIPYNYGNDHIVGDAKYFCPKYNALLKQYLTGDGLSVYKDDLKLYAYCTSHTGRNITSPEDIYQLYKILITEYEYGLELPKWTKSIWKDSVYNAAVKRFIVRTGTTELKRLTGGWFLKKVIEDTVGKIKGTLNPQERKLFLYSGHETNIGIILRTLGVFDNEIPNYGAQILFEVRLIGGVYGYKIWYHAYRGKHDPKLLTIPGCDSFCPLDQFMKILHNVIPTNISECEE